MTLIKCRECSNEISTTAKACPKCGASQRRKTGATGWLLLALSCGFVYFLFSGAPSQKAEISSYTANTKAATRPTPNSEEVNRQIAIDSLNIKKFRWRTGGFDNIMVISVTLENSGKNAVKDIAFQCSTRGNSGTNLGSNTKLIYELIPAGKSKSVKEFSMGFISKQASEASCRVVDLKFECSSASPCQF